MQESTLHYIWKFLRFETSKAYALDGQNIDIIHQGHHNTEESGPDFLNAKLKIGEHLWAGNVEIHIKSSDWYAHNHETDKAYDSVILHVVWEDDVEIFRSDNSLLPTLELKNLVSGELLSRIQHLIQNESKTWINCESSFSSLDSFTVSSWLQRLYVERLESKCQEVEQLLEYTQNDWESVLFKMLAKGFGLNVNGSFFLEMSNTFSFSVVRKLQAKPKLLEALLFGQSNMLGSSNDAYVNELEVNYKYLQQKFQLEDQVKLKPKYFRLRPHNFPTIRLAQLSALYSKEKGLFSKIIETKDIQGFYKLFQVELNDYWQTHYTFQKTHARKNKHLTKNFIDLLIINCVAPVMFAYQNELGKQSTHILELVSSMSLEKNSIVSKFNDIRPQTATNAMESQALLQLKKNYCDMSNCLSCNFGSKLIKSCEIQNNR